MTRRRGTLRPPSAGTGERGLSWRRSRGAKSMRPPLTSRARQCAVHLAAQYLQLIFGRVQLGREIVARSASLAVPGSQLRIRGHSRSDLVRLTDGMQDRRHQLQRGLVIGLPTGAHSSNTPLRHPATRRATSTACHAPMRLARRSVTTRMRLVPTRRSPSSIDSQAEALPTLSGRRRGPDCRAHVRRSIDVGSGDDDARDPRGARVAHQSGVERHRLGR